MRRILAFFLCLCVLLTVCGCAKTRVDSHSQVELNFVYDAQNIHVILSDAEAATVIDILNGNVYQTAFSGVPSCGFDENISLTIGDQVYAIACDTCNQIQELPNGRFFTVSKGDMAYIRSVFEAYGGYFPCV